MKIPLGPRCVSCELESRRLSGGSTQPVAGKAGNAKTPRAAAFGVSHKPEGGVCAQTPDEARQGIHCANHQFVEVGAWQISRLRRKFILEWYPWNPLETPLPIPAPPQSVNRDPLAKARFYQSLLDSGVVPNRAALARYLGTSRANITQVLNRLKRSIAGNGEASS